VKSIYIDIQVRAVDDSLNLEDAERKDTLHVPIKSTEVVPPPPEISENFGGGIMKDGEVDLEEDREEHGGELKRDL
jgi:hypothetical protein